MTSAILRGRQARAQRGSGTVAGLALVLVILTSLLAVLLIAQAVRPRAEADTAADLAALSAATALHSIGAGEQPCAVAAQVARRNHAQVTACSIDGEDVVVEVAVPAHLGVLGDRRAVAQARAGPAAP